MKMIPHNFARELKRAKSLWKHLPRHTIETLKNLLNEHLLSVAAGDISLIQGSWYVTHTGLLRLAERRHCHGIHTQPILKSSDPANAKWVFRATVFKTRSCKGFTGYGDADPSNVSQLVRGAEMRVAETRAVNRALRKAYGIGICSVEEIGAVPPFRRDEQQQPNPGKLPPRSQSGNGRNGHANNGNGNRNGTGNGPRVRDRLCQLIRQHSLDAELVKAYAVDFCGTKALRDASREQVENFVTHLADWAEKDRNALLCQLNSYSRPQAGAA